MTDAKPLTGRKVFLIVATAFGIIITVNLVMAWNAVSSFPGLEVRNSYVASQGFNDRLAAQRALGWTMEVEQTDTQVTLVFTDETGAPVPVASVEAFVARPTHTRDDTALTFTRSGNRFAAPVDLAPGNWNIHVAAQSIDGRDFAQRVPLRVRGVQ